MSSHHDLPEDRGSPLDFIMARQSRRTLPSLQHALAGRNAILAYQPVVQTDPPGHVAFYQGLIRMIDPGGRFIPLHDVRSFAELSGLGPRIDCLSLALALHALAEAPSLRLSITMSAHALCHPEWLAVLQGGLRMDDSLVERLILEITEDSVMEMPDVIGDYMAELQDRGISFSLGGFGAGSTSFRHLRDFGFDMIRIDGQFSRQIRHEPDNQVLMRAMQMIAHHFDMFTIAECVETAEDARYLTDAGISCLQGPHFGAPTTLPPWKSSACRGPLR